MAIKSLELLMDELNDVVVHDKYYHIKRKKDINLNIEYEENVDYKIKIPTELQDLSWVYVISCKLGSNRVAYVGISTCLKNRINDHQINSSMTWFLHNIKNARYQLVATSKAYCSKSDLEVLESYWIDDCVRRSYIVMNDKLSTRQIDGSTDRFITPKTKDKLKEELEERFDLLYDDVEAGLNNVELNRNISRQSLLSKL